MLLICSSLYKNGTGWVGNSWYVSRELWKAHLFSETFYENVLDQNGTVQIFFFFLTTLLLLNKSSKLVDKQLSLVGDGVRDHIVDTGTAALPI